MEFSIKVASADKVKTDCVVVGVFEDGKLSPSAALIDKATGKRLSELARRGDLPGKSGATLLLPALAGIGATRVLLIGLGKERELHDKDFREAVRTATRALLETGAKEAVLFLAEVKTGKCEQAWKIEHVILVANEVIYRFDGYKSKKEQPLPALAHLTIAVASMTKAFEHAVTIGNAIASGVALAKDLGNTPPNVCTPAYLGQQAQALGKKHKLKVDVLEQKDMEKLGMGSLLAVARGSRNPPRLIVIHYQGGAKGEKPVVLVGKGITFDTGGISLKPGPDMDEMKYDMSGAGSVIGTMQAVAMMKPKLNVIGVVPTCENMPDGNAYRPGDIVTSMSGQTIEILNTDAEGRLILNDALTYVERFNPQAVVDMATLTGACVIALGHVVHGLYANQDSLAHELLEAGQTAYDRAWHMPLWDDYQEQLRSNFADMANIGGRPAGSITAACFLSRYAKKYHWAHLDIAGTAYKSGREKGSTGRPVGLLCHFVLDRAKH